MSEVLFTDYIRVASDEYLQRYLGRKMSDHITMMHKQAVRDKLARRKAKR